MSTLLLRLAGPMQAWGTQSRFRERDTGREPSKSGVIGLLCAALGKPREERPESDFPRLAELTQLRMGVRVDADGTVGVDFHTAGGTHRSGEAYGVRRASGAHGETVISRRYYLAGASFLVGLEGDEALLRRLDEALVRPVWQLCLGRKAFVPGMPVRLPDTPPRGPGLIAASLEEALRLYPWPGRVDRLRCIAEVSAPGPDTEVRQDVPLDFAARRFGLRSVTTTFIDRPTDASAAMPEEA